DEQAHPAVSKNGDFRICRDVHLLEDAATSGNRLDEHRRPVREAVRNRVEVARGQRDVLGKRAAAPADTKHAAVAAMLAHAGRTEVALTAANVDLSGDAPADPLAILGRGGGFDDANELVAW